ncbi:MAG: polysaccharide biosynthesis/export family protein [Verrucomicrobiota bacterium]|jgi:polysaccharide export outer membrane protein
MSRTKIDKAVPRWGTVCGLLLTGLFLAGCRAGTAHYSAVPGGASLAPATPQASAGAPAAAARLPSSDLLRVGDSLTITFLDLPGTVPPFERTIKEDGSITLLLNQPFQAAGKTIGELEKEIREHYVPKYYKYLTVTVRPLGQYYSVKGEVRSPNRYPYLNDTTVLKAIASAGDFTDFARKRKVKLYRTNGRIETEDCVKALRNPRLDLPVYPGDWINVSRRTLPWQK